MVEAGSDYKRAFVVGMRIAAINKSVGEVQSLAGRKVGDDQVWRCWYYLQMVRFGCSEKHSFEAVGCVIAGSIHRKKCCVSV